MHYQIDEFRLRAVKQAMRHVRTMDMSQARDYLEAKDAAIRVNDPENSYQNGLSQFIDKKSYRPVYEPFKLGTAGPGATQPRKGG